MGVSIIYPTTEEGMQALQDRMAETYIQMIKDYIQKMECPPHQKVELFEAIKENFRIRAEKEIEAKKIYENKFKK